MAHETSTPAPEAPPRARLARLIAWLGRPRARLLVLLAVALLIGLPALGNGFALDDLLLLGEGARAPGDPQAMFELGPQTPAEVDAWRRDGLYPWWASDALQIRFFRPLSALSHALDLALWPTSTRLMHLHSLAWYLLLVAAAGALYREVLRERDAAPRRAAGLAGLALLVYAIDDAHGANVGWLAARNSAIGGALAIAALLAHVRARSRGWRIGQVLAPAALALALLAAEASIAVLGYFAAYAVVLDPAPSWRRRAAALLPSIAVVVAWLALYRALGYGATGCGLYTDPLADPLGFVAAAITRGALLIGAQLGLPMVVDLVGFIPGASAVAAGLFLALIALVAWILAPLLRRCAAARFFALGMLLAAAAHGTTVPQERYLLLVGVGGAGLVAATIAALAWGELRGRLARALAWLWIVLHVAAPPLLAAPRTTGTSTLHASLERAAAALPQTDAAAPIVLLNAPGDLFALYVPALREAAGAAPRGVHLLYAGAGAITVERPSAAQLVLRAPWLAAPGDRVLRDLGDPLRVGERVDVDGLHIEVLEVDERGAPRAIRVDLSAPLEAGPARWFAWIDGAPRPWAPPAVGESAALAPATWDFATPGAAP
ncbi:MAG: hypothetical protein R3A79_06085 [Nannocystaceae bacterium]